MLAGDRCCLATPAGDLGPQCCDKARDRHGDDQADELEKGEK